MVRAVSPLPKPADDPFWLSCPVGELVWAYRRSAGTSENPELLGEVWVDGEGRAKAQGGSRDLLAVFAQRRDEVIGWVSAACADCDGQVGASGPLPASGDRLCGSCFDRRARLLAPGGLFDRGVIDERCRAVGDPDGQVVTPSEFPQWVDRDGLALPAEDVGKVVPFGPRESGAALGDPAVGVSAADG